MYTGFIQISIYKISGLLLLTLNLLTYHNQLIILWLKVWDKTDEHESTREGG